MEHACSINQCSLMSYKEITQHVKFSFALKGIYMLDKLHPVDQLRTVLDNSKGMLGEAVDGFCRLFKVRLCGNYHSCNDHIPDSEYYW